jgi:hypothetical protein
MVSSYKNPTRIVRKVEEVSTAWERIAPAVEFAGMSLADFREAVAESFTIRTKAAELEAELSANIARRALADENTNAKLKFVVNSVKGHPAYGENSDLYRAMGYVTAADRATGLTRKGATEAAADPEPAAAAL